MTNPTRPDWANPRLTGTNKEPGHATLMPFADFNSALDCRDPRAARNFALLPIAERRMGVFRRAQPRLRAGRFRAARL